MPSMPQAINLPAQLPAYGKVTYERHDASDSPADARSAAGDAYLVQLATLAHQLVAQAGARADVAAIRVLRQRLTQWVEDVRSVGGLDQLASAVEQLVNRLSAALASSAPGSEFAALAAELARLAAGATPVPGPPGSKPKRSFWK